METAEKTLCAFCDKEVKDIDANWYLIRCHDHDLVAKEEEKKFFAEYPDVTTWKNVPKSRLTFK